MLNKQRMKTSKFFPKECYTASFYDFFAEGKCFDLREHKIIATNTSMTNREEHLNIYFFIKEISKIVKLSIPKLLEIYKVSDWGCTQSKDVKLLTDYDAFNPLNPLGTFAYLINFEDRLFRINKRLTGKSTIYNMLERYESIINYNAYEVDYLSEYNYFCSYEEFYHFTQLSLAKINDEDK